MVRFQSDAGTGGLLDAVDRLSPLPSELPGGPGWTGGIPRPALSPSDSDNVRALAHLWSRAVLTTNPLTPVIVAWRTSS